MGRTVCFGDESSRRARYGRIRPMPRKSVLGRIVDRLAGNR